MIYNDYSELDPGNFAPVNHTHSEYATTAHTHSQYATTSTVSNIDSRVTELETNPPSKIYKYYSTEELPAQSPYSDTSGPGYIILNLTNTTQNPTALVIRTLIIDGVEFGNMTCGGSAFLFFKKSISFSSTSYKVKIYKYYLE